jgi:hypothetical protein
MSDFHLLAAPIPGVYAFGGLIRLTGRPGVWGMEEAVVDAECGGGKWVVGVGAGSSVVEAQCLERNG